MKSNLLTYTFTAISVAITSATIAHYAKDWTLSYLVAAGIPALFALVVLIESGEA